MEDNGESKIILVYNKDKKWNVYDERSCPDLKSLPKHCYKEYSVPINQYESAFQNLLEATIELHKRRVVPKNNGKRIFPELSDLLKDRIESQEQEVMPEE